MELNTEGFYKKPRFLSGFKFLSHITETRKCGNRMPVYFPNQGTIDVIDYRLNPSDRFDYDGELEHFYSMKNTRLRVREGKISTEYLLDHVKRMHV